ncbi:MAG: FlgD immunoglobulin-like domain containing protein [Candidatus Methylacidiphilales bacterium]
MLPARILAAAAAAPGPDDFVTVSDVASPRVAYSISKTANAINLTVDVAGFDPVPASVPSPAPSSAIPVADPQLQIGLTVDKTVVLTNKEAKIQKMKDTVRYVFIVPASSLGSSGASKPADLSRLKLAIAVEWPGAIAALSPRQREVFLHKPGRATHSGLSKNTADWLALDVAEFERAATDRKQRIAFDFKQPVEGKATIVIEDAAGKRVRNLISGQTLGAGTHRITWDGCDDSGLIVAPGKYSWRSISHPGLANSYLFSFCNGPGSNHGTFQAAATNGTLNFFGSPVSEGGYQVVSLQPDGTFVRGSNAPLGTGLQCIRLAADEKYIYAAYDGTYWGQNLDKKKPDWKADRRIALVRFDISTGAPVDFPRTPTRFSILRTYEVGPGSPGGRGEETVLAGLAYLNGKLYMADRASNEIMEIDPETGKGGRTINNTANVIALTAAKDSLYAIARPNKADGTFADASSPTFLYRINPATGLPDTDSPSAPLEGKPAGLAVDKDGNFYISDSEENVVRIYAAATRNLTSTLGKPGPLKPGPYDPLQFQNPAGLTVGPNGWLWVTEPNRWAPKRLAAFDPRAGTMMVQHFGPTSYGAPGASFDPTDKNKWIGQGTAFTLDFEKKTATPTTVLGGEDGMHYRWWRQDGRTFLITYGKVTYIQEVMPDGTLRKLAFLSSAHQYSYSHKWNPEPEFVAAFQRDYPTQKYESGAYGRPGHGFGMLWADRNGNGKMDTDEIEFSTVAENMAGSGWGHDFYDLTLRVTATVKGKPVLVTLKPDGWWPGGAPKYPALNPTVEAGFPITLPPGGGNPESTVDRFGTLIVNSEPRMRAFASDGSEKWSFPNNWTNVHGSQKAPLPNTGELQGVLFFTGVASLDDKSDVLAMNGNHGRLFFMSSDGLYLDELFSDVRLTSTQDFTDRNILGGECFGGSFGKDEKSGNYYFQGGGIEYRIYQIKGLDKMTRGNGTLNVTAEQIVAAERNVIRKAAEQVVTKAAIPFRATAPTIDGKDADWKDQPETARWEQSGGRFPVNIKAAYDAQKLYLLYTVRDESPWVNNGSDWQSLFKTGDGIDIQLGTDPTANPARSGPVPGDIRLFIAPSKEGNTAVLYRHRLKPGTGTATTDSVMFQSPWRSEKVDSVRKLTSAEIAVTKENNNLYRVEVAVPLADIGLDPATVAGKSLRGDFGVIYGDAAGTVNILRSYWSNKATGLVNDVPGEIMLTPNAWGDITVEAKK